MANRARDFYYLDDYERASQEVLDEMSASYILGSYCFLGEHDKARTLFRQFKSSFSEPQKVFCRFHLGISYTRTSDYPKAREFFLENWKKRHFKEFGAIERFLIYQGLSFFRYFFSKHESSLAFAKKADEQFLTSKERPMSLYQALVWELIGHNYYQLGRAAKGEVFFKKALEVSEKNHFTQLTQELKASLLIYQSQYELDVSKNISKLKKLLNQTSESNDYTFSELVLQISKLFFLRGQYRKANEFLLQNFNVIYKNDNKRKVAILNTLLAQLLIPKQQYMEALSLLKVAKGNLNNQIDINLLAPILGVERKILGILEQETSVIDQELNSLLEETDKAILHQVQKRELGLPLETHEEDQLGVLFDRVHRGDKNAIDLIIKHQLLHLIPKLFGPLPKKKAIIVHPQNLGLFILDEDEVSYNSHKLSKNQIHFLGEMAGHGKSKAELVKAIWGYNEYDPFRHDHLVYTMVKRLRKVLGDKSAWINSAGEDSYQIEPEVALILRKSEEKKKVEKKIEEAFEVPHDLNFRQLQIIEGIFEGPFSAGQVTKHFQTTRMTAYRDLDDLVKKGYLLKRGEKRGTRYTLQV